MPLPTANTPRDNVGFMPWVTVQCGLPHSRQTKSDGTERTEYERRNGSALLMMTARQNVGLPYGKIPRLVLAHMVRAYMRQAQHMPAKEARTIDLGHSFAEFAGQLGMARKGGGPRGSMSRFRNQAIRLIQCDIADKGADHTWQRVAVADKMRLWWNAEPAPGSISLFPNYVRLSEGFAESCRGAVPVNIDTIIALRSPFQIDLYAWLSYRAGGMHSRGQKRALISWEALQQQFGHGYARICDFRKAFRRHLRIVIDHYPVRVEADHLGIVVFARAPHVGRRWNQ